MYLTTDWNQAKHLFRSLRRPAGVGEGLASAGRRRAVVVLRAAAACPVSDWGGAKCGITGSPRRTKRRIDHANEERQTNYYAARKRGHDFASQRFLSHCWGIMVARDLQKGCYRGEKKTKPRAHVQIIRTLSHQRSSSPFWWAGVAQGKRTQQGLLLTICCGCLVFCIWNAGAPSLIAQCERRETLDIPQWPDPKKRRSPLTFNMERVLSSSGDSYMFRSSHFSGGLLAGGMRE